MIKLTAVIDFSTIFFLWTPSGSWLESRSNNLGKFSFYYETLVLITSLPCPRHYFPLFSSFFFISLLFSSIVKESFLGNFQLLIQVTRRFFDLCVCERKAILSVLRELPGLNTGCYGLQWSRLGADTASETASRSFQLCADNLAF